MIRPAPPEDAAACARILNDRIDTTEWMPRVHVRDAVDRHSRELVLPKRRVLVATAADRVEGFVAVDDGMVTARYLAPGARNRGLGQTLLDAVRDGPQRLWTFVANADARRFYARAGCAEIRRTDGDNEERLPDILLERPA